MTNGHDLSPRMIPATMVIHQEGVIALIALIGVWLRDDGLVTAFAPQGRMAISLGSGAGVGLACFGLLWLVRGVGAFRDLEPWPRRGV